jgi:Ca2+-binding RTX toxin-like protein
MGEGSNDSNFSDACTDLATATITAGAGDDTLRGGSPTTSTTIFAGGGPDTLNGGEGVDVFQGGEGADLLFGTGGNDQLYGEGGNDTLKGAAGNDIEDGGPGDDNIGGLLGLSSPRDNDQSADTLRGGDGTDQLVLESHVGAMTISPDGQPNDGARGEGDNIAGDFEQIDGTGGNDVFMGSPGPDKFLGGGGNDEIHGGDGADNLSGDGGDDRVYGDAGNDKVEGTNGADTVDGGPGADQIYGDIASCSVFCNSDPDLLFARDGGRDTVDCGGGADTAQVDQLDVVAFCTVVDRQTVGGPGGGAPDPFGLKVAGSARSKALLKRGLTVRLTCPGACKIVAELRYKSKKLGSARKTLKEGRGRQARGEDLEEGQADDPQAQEGQPQATSEGDRGWEDDDADQDGEVQA